MLPRHLLVTLGAIALFALAGCGTNTQVCNLANCCGPGVAACPIGPQHLYAAGITGQVTTFTVLPGGDLVNPVSISGPAVALGMAAVNNQFLYVSNLRTQALDGWSISPGSGALTPLQGSPFGVGMFSVGAGLATNNAASVLYVADFAKIDAFKIDSMGTPTALSGSIFSSGSNEFLAIDPQNRFLFASEEGPPGGVDAFTIDSTGALTVVAGSPFPAIPNFVGNPQPGTIVVDPTGSFVYLALVNTGQIAAYSIVTPGGALNPAPGSPFAAGNMPLSMTVANHFLYAANALDGTLSGYSIAPTTGILTPLSGSPFQIRASALASDPAGSILYASGATGIMVFSIDSSGGLTPVTGSPFASGPATEMTIVP